MQVAAVMPAAGTLGALGPVAQAGSEVQAQAQPGAEAAVSAPCILAANRTGLYHELLRFDAACEHQVRRVKDAVEALALVDGCLAFRVSTAQYPHTVLQHYSCRHGWTLA